MMKNMFLILSILFLITGCSEEEAKQQESSIYGTWQLTKRQHVLPSSIQIIENGEIITFTSSGSFNSDSYLCEGSYVIIDDFIIEVSFQCRDEISFSYSSENNELILRRAFGFEGGYDEYEKISSE